MVENPLNLIKASVIGSGVSAATNILGNELSYYRQKQLDDYKYSNMIRFAKANGATPSAIVQGITGNAGGSIPQVSTSNNPVSDFGQSISNAVSSQAAQGNANAALTNAETERQLGLMKLRFEPAKYFADIRESLANAFKSTKEAFLHGSMSRYYNELANDIVKVRPWKLAGLRQGLINDIATYNKIVQETKTSKAQEGYYKSASHELDTRSDVNIANANAIWSSSFNESLRGFRLQWENTLLLAGIDPSKPFWENTGRLMYTDPELFNKRMDMFITSLNDIDGKLQDNLGEHYKRNIAFGYGLYRLNQIHQKNANNRAYRFGVFGNTISSFIPFAGGQSPSYPVDTKLPKYMEWMDY